MRFFFIIIYKHKVSSNYVLKFVHFCGPDFFYIPTYMEEKQCVISQATSAKNKQHPFFAK